MKPSRVGEVITSLLDTRWPVFVWGPPGVGKSSIVRSVAEERRVPLLDVRASLLDPTDLRGIPMVVDGRAVWCPPSFLPDDRQPSGILFFDELNAAPPLVQASLYQLTLDRRVGEYVLPPGWSIVAAGNRSEDASVVFRMPAALANRFVHLDFEVSFDDWRAWALGAGIHPLVTSFLAVRRELLFDMRKPERGYPTPRSWEIVSDAFKAAGSLEAVRDVILGIVGEGAAVEFLAHCEQALSEEQVSAIVEAPETADLPESLSGRYALVSYLIAQASKVKILAASAVLLRRLPAELSVLLARDLLRSNPRFSLQPAFKAFVRKHPAAFA
jgi:MoxR-like ATPase